jgi:hypothetical protein
MEHLSGPVHRHTPRATESPRRASNDLHFLSRSRPSDQFGSRPTQSEHERDVVRSLSQSRSSADMPARPHDTPSLHRQSLDRLTTPKSEHDPQQEDIIRSLSRPKSSDGLTSRRVQPERGPVRTSRSLEKSNPNTTAEKNKPLEAHTSSEPPTPPSTVVESSGVQPRSSTLSSRLLRSTEIWTPSSAPTQIGDTIQSPGNSASFFREYPDEITPVVPSTSYRLEPLSRDHMGERGRNQTDDQDAFLSALGITEQSTLGITEVQEYAQIIMDVVKAGGNEQNLLGRLREKRTHLSRERDQANNRDVETLLKALGIRDDDLGSGNYLEASKHAQTIVRVIRTDGHDKEFNDASEALLKLTPQRFWLRSLVNPRKDTIDWYNASWRNQHAMSKLDTTTWGGSIRKLFYQANQPIAGLTNTRLGNVGFIGLQAVLGTAYTSYIEKAFASSTFESSIEYAATARFFYSKLPNPLNQLIDTIQFQGVSIGLYQALASHAHNATTGG